MTIFFQPTKHFNPRSPCGERRVAIWRSCAILSFQSTLPVRGATKRLKRSRIRETFQSTLPVRGATRLRTTACSVEEDFNPRSPCGERPSHPRLCPKCYIFQSTLPVRGATLYAPSLLRIKRISIHAPRAGSDLCFLFGGTPHIYFNPRSPCGERQQYIVLLQAQSAIYTQSAILSIVNAIKGRRLLIEFGAKACGISCVLQIRTHKTSGSSTGIVSFEP